ncbi:ERCC8 [Branchiostoma lanceolatum]|uniref:ERCC8 protein n=1 Tax=Branchiostoma lanceolatum TaxID=7740 RepID=A0A8J9YWW5_BRALA|nr:ERCC8 [Branchiostoma lanceolatum]
MLNFLSCRENGTLDPLALVRAEATRRTFSLELSKEQDVKRIHASGVNSLDLDPVEGRYLISGGADGVIAIYDTHNLSGTPSNTSEAVCTVGRSHRHVHKYSVETVRWYPHDTGLFTSSSMDKTLKVWDTNVLLPAEVFQFEGTVYSHAMSPVAKKHCLIAVATMTSIVTLCDLKSGSSTHILKGHRAAVKCARWSPRNPYLLATGSQDNKVLLWDVRSAKSSLMSLDQHNGELATSTAAVNTAHNGHVNGLCFTPEGLHLLSFGTDNRLRLWDTATGRNTLTTVPSRCSTCSVGPVYTGWWDTTTMCNVVSSTLTLRSCTVEGVTVISWCGYLIWAGGRIMKSPKNRKQSLARGAKLPRHIKTHGVVMRTEGASIVHCGGWQDPGTAQK